MKGKITEITFEIRSGEKIVKSPKTCFRCGKKNMTTACKFGSFNVLNDSLSNTKVLRISWTSFCYDCTELIQKFVGFKEKS